jgi:hypothetical protein
LPHRSPHFVAEALLTFSRISGFEDAVVFPIADPVSDQVYRLHCWSPSRRDWRCEPFNDFPLTPLVLGQLRTAVQVHCQESQWDLFALIDASRCYNLEGVAFVATRGAQNVKHLKTIRDQVRPDAQVILWPQRDVPNEKGKIASRVWLAKMQQLFAGRRVCIAWIPDRTPGKKFDFNDWLRAEPGPTPSEVDWLIENAELIEPHRDELGKNRPRLNLSEEEADNGQQPDLSPVSGRGSNGQVRLRGELQRQQRLGLQHRCQRRPDAGPRFALRSGDRAPVSRYYPAGAFRLVLR